MAKLYPHDDNVMNHYHRVIEVCRSIDGIEAYMIQPNKYIDILKYISMQIRYLWLIEDIAIVVQGGGPCI